MKYPAITICPKVSTKYGIAERLGNYLDPNNLPENALSLKQEIFKFGFKSPSDIDKNYADDYFVKSDSTSGSGKTQNMHSRRFLDNFRIHCWGLARVDGTGGLGAQVPHLFWIYIVKISKFLRFGMKIFFLFSCASHKKFASVHPANKIL